MQSRPKKSEALTAATGRASSEVSQVITQGNNMLNSTALIIGSTNVRQVGDLYSLNDLHKASGGEDKHQPAKFIRLDQTKALIYEVENSPEVASSETAGIPAVKVKEGRSGGTYACKELVIAYAAWISAAFHLKVIRVFLASMAPTTRPANPAIDYDRISPAQAQDLKQIAEAIVKAGVQGYAETWARLPKKFRVNSYLELPATRHLEARQYLIAKLPQGYAEGVAEEKPAQRASLDDRVRLGHAFAMASQTGAKVQQAVFAGVMDANSDWKHGRYLLSLDTSGPDQEVVARVRQIESSACVVPVSRSHAVIEETMAPDADTLMLLAQTCMRKLGGMARGREVAKRAQPGAMKTVEA